MTAQIPDTFLLDDSVFSLVGINGNGLFDPERFGILPIGTCSACWRGHTCSYSLRNDALLLDQLCLTLGHFDGADFVAEVGPVINGVEASRSTHAQSIFNNMYNNLNLSIDFTGGLLVGREFIEELYVHMGFHPAWKYREVFELLFEKGNLKEKRNVSKAMQELREKMVNYPMEPEYKASEEEVKSWIESTFRLDYSF